MDNENRCESNRKVIPCIWIESPSVRNRKSYISSSGSEESIPYDAPLVRQTRCSVDIDTIPTELREKKIKVNGIDDHSNAYSELRESIQDIT